MLDNAALTSAGQDYALFLDAFVEFFIAFSEGAHVDVMFIALCLGQLLAYQVGKLERIHAADARAVFVVILVARSHAVNDRNTLWLCAIRFEDPLILFSLLVLLFR